MTDQNTRIKAEARCLTSASRAATPAGSGLFNGAPVRSTRRCRTMRVSSTATTRTAGR
jgi:hypothetical protein